MHTEFWLGDLHLISGLRRQILKWMLGKCNQWLKEKDIKMDVGEMCCIEEVFQTAVVGHLNLNNILKLGECNCSTHLLELVKFYKISYWQHKLVF
jgi:hypothetical protein